MTDLIAARTELRNALTTHLALAMGGSYPLNTEPLTKVVAGEFANGVEASLSDNDDQIEFGLTRRADGEYSNLLHVSVLVDEFPFSVSCSSDLDEALNYDADADQAHVLRLVLRASAMMQGK